MLDFKSHDSVTRSCKVVMTAYSQHPPPLSECAIDNVRSDRCICAGDQLVAHTQHDRFCAHGEHTNGRSGHKVRLHSWECPDADENAHISGFLAAGPSDGGCT